MPLEGHGRVALSGKLAWRYVRSPTITQEIPSRSMFPTESTSGSIERKRTTAGAIRRCLILVQAALSSTDTPNIAIDMAKKNEASLAHVLGAFPRGRHLSTGGDLYRLRRHIFHHHLSQSLGVNWLYHKFRNLQAHGHAIDPGELARVSPLAHRHINFLGRYATLILIGLSQNLMLVDRSSRTHGPTLTE